MRIGWVTLGLLSFAAAAAWLTWPAAAEPTGNQAACRRYVAHMNELPCLPIELDPDQLCPGALDVVEIQLEGYYDCLVQESRCDGDTPDMTGMSGCQVP